MKIQTKLVSRKAPHKLLRGSAGFTLIEMLVVLVIIGPVSYTHLTLPTILRV